MTDSKDTSSQAAGMTTSDKITAVCFHPTMPHIAAVGETPTARIYDVTTGKFVAFIPLPGLGTHVCYSHDGKFLATASCDPDWTSPEDQENQSAQQVCLWNARDGYRLVKSDTFGNRSMTRKIMRKYDWGDESAKAEEIKKEMHYITSSYYKLHMKPIIALQFLRPWVAVAPSKKKKHNNNNGEDEKVHDKDEEYTSVEPDYRQIEVLFSASEDDILRFWEFNPRWDDSRKTIPCEVHKDYSQGLRYLASLRHMDRIRDHDGVSKRHENYIAARVSDDGRILCTLDTNSRTACLVKLAYEKMLSNEKVNQLDDRADHVPRDSERTISLPLILHQFEPSIQMQCIDFCMPVPSEQQRREVGIATARGIISGRDTNRVVGSYHVVFGGRSTGEGKKSMIESIILEAANKSGDGSLDTMLRSQDRPDEQELSPFILEASGVLSGSVKKMRIKMSKKIQISNNQETITRVTHATKFNGTINAICVSPDGNCIATGDQYTSGSVQTHVASSWTPIPNGFSRKTIGNHMGKITCISYPTSHTLTALRECLKSKLTYKDTVLLSCGDATIHAWRQRMTGFGTDNPDRKQDDTSNATTTGDQERVQASSKELPLLTIEHQITAKQRKDQEMIDAEVKMLETELKSDRKKESVDSSEKSHDLHEKLMKETLNTILNGDKGDQKSCACPC
uniref:Uncharacterized protein n=1 Tax=Lotharella globosa TaxID=91324 RepID=A0A7S3YWE2_9EUKA